MANPVFSGGNIAGDVLPDVTGRKMGSLTQLWNFFAQKLNYAGATSGQTIIQASAVASGTLTLPAATDTLVGKATTDTLTNKTISGSANTLTNIPTIALAANAATQDSFVALAADFSTSGAIYASVTGASLTITTTGGDVLLFFCGPAHATTQAAFLTLSIDGVNLGGTLALLNAGGALNLTTSFFYIKSGLAAGSHTFIVRGATVAGGTLTMNFNSQSNGMFAVVELKR